MEELLQKVIVKIYQLNQKMKHDFFFNFEGHTNTFSIDYCKNGFRANEKTTYIIDLCTKLTEKNLKKALERLEEIEKEG